MPAHKLGQKSPPSIKNSGQGNVAVIVTVFNESLTILNLLDVLKSQTLLPHEVVIVDGGSSDNTYSILQKYAKIWNRLKVYRQKGNRSLGRNFGVSHSSSPLIAFTDAGCLPEPNWLENIVAPFSDKNVQIVSGYYRGLAANIFQKCLIPYVLVMPDKATKSEFFPSTRSMALRRTVWNRSGGFDLRMSHNEDYAYAHWLKKMGYSFTFTPDAIVHWIPRKNISEAFWMFLRFSLGDIQSKIFRPQVKLLLIRFFVFAFLFSLAIEVHSLFYPLFILFVAYLFWAVLKNFRYVKDLRAIFWLPIIQLTSDIAVLFGTVIGMLSK